MDSKNKMMRDEGLIVGKDSPTVFEHEAETLNLKQILKKYVSHLLIQKIDLKFPENLWNDTTNKVGPFSCPIDLHDQNRNMWILLAISILVLGLIANIWYCSSVEEE